MEIQVVRNNLIVIASMGFAMFIVGLILYTNASRVAPYMRYLLPLPPIAVAAYIYVLNVVGAQGDLLAAALRSRTLNIGQDLFMETAIGTISFVLITLLLLGQYYVISTFFSK